MKIALMHFAYPPAIGGVETLLGNQVRILTELGYDVRVLAGSGEENNKKVDLVVVPEIQAVLRFNPELQEKMVQRGILDDDFSRLTDRIEEALSQHLGDRDIVIVHNMLTLVHNLPFIAAFKRYVRDSGKPIIIWAHDQTFIDGERVTVEKVGVALSPEGKKLLLEPVEGAVYVTISKTFQTLFASVMNLPEDKIKVIPNGVDLPGFLNISPRIWTLFKDHGLLNRFPLILSPINLLRRKNLEYALAVAAELRNAYPSLAVLITGSSSRHRANQDYRQEIQETIDTLSLADSILFLDDGSDRGFNPIEMHNLYALSDAVFYFSKSENFGLPIIEAALSKTPIFVSHLHVFQEIGEGKIESINTIKTSPIDAAIRVKTYIEANPQLVHSSRMRQVYNLEKIIQEHLIPLMREMVKP